MVLLPADLDSAYNALLNAVRSGEIPEGQIDGSVRKILLAKQSDGRIVQFGLVRIWLPYCSAEVRAEILAQKTPLGS